MQKIYPQLPESKHAVPYELRKSYKNIHSVLAVPHSCTFGMLPTQQQSMLFDAPQATVATLFSKFLPFVDVSQPLMTEEHEGRKRIEIDFPLWTYFKHQRSDHFNDYVAVFMPQKIRAVLFVSDIKREVLEGTAFESELWSYSVSSTVSNLPIAPCQSAHSLSVATCTLIAQIVYAIGPIIADTNYELVRAGLLRYPEEVSP